MKKKYYLLEIEFSELLVEDIMQDSNNHSVETGNGGSASFDDDDMDTEGNP